MSWTLASHVPIFIACFISPLVAVAVAIGSALGFLFTAPIWVAARAATHLIFALFLAIYLKKSQSIKFWHMMLIAIIVGVIHGVCEALIIQFFFFSTVKGEPMFYVWVLVGFGTFVHSIIDFYLARILWRVLKFENFGLKRKPE